MTRRMAPLRNCIKSASVVMPGGVFPTNNSRLILSIGLAVKLDIAPLLERGGPEIEWGLPLGIPEDDEEP